MSNARAEDPDASEPVGALSLWREASARRSLLGASGEIVYGAEEPIGVALLPRCAEWDGSEARLWRLEVKAERGAAAGGVQPGDHLVMAEHPYASGLVEHAAFKRGSHRGRDHAAPLRGSTLAAVAQELDRREHDLWETGRALTAAFSTSPAAPVFACRPRSYRARGRLLFGICEDFPEELRQLRLSARADQLLAATRTGTLVLYRPGNGREAPVPVSVHPECAEAAEVILLTSLRQALAGPKEGAQPPRCRMSETTKSDPWIGIPVIDLAERIYRSHLFNCTRTIWRREKKQIAWPDVDDLGGIGRT